MEEIKNQTKNIALMRKFEPILLFDFEITIIFVIVNQD